RGEGPADEAGDHDLAALGERPDRKVERLVRADEITGRIDTAFGGDEERLAGACIGRIENRAGAGLERRLALYRIDLGNDRRVIKHRAGERKPHLADAAEADQQRRSAPG